MTTKLTSNYPGYSANDIPTNQKFITLRTAQDDPMSWVEFDNNFELLRHSVNSLVDDIAVVREDVDYGAEIAVINENIQANYTELDTKFNDYLTLTALDERYAVTSDIIDAYTKTEVDANFAARNDLNDYVQTQALDDYVTGTELTTFGANYALSTDVPDAYTKQESDARYYQGTPNAGESRLPDGYVNADNYCVGDGVTDDTLNLQDAINSLGSKGGTVLLGSKTYLLANNDGNMPWDEIPTTLDGDAILKGNGANGALDGTEDFLHPAYIIYATVRNLTQDSSGFQSMVGTWSGTEFLGGTDSAGFNYWATSNEPAITLWASIYEAEIPSKHLEVSDHVSIVGTTESCGAPSWNQSTGSYATPKGSTILIRDNTTITLKKDTALRNVSVLKDGLNGLVSSFGGYGVRPSGDDVTIENCFIGGFEYGIYANWSSPDTSMKGNMSGPGGRLRVTQCNMDNKNSILVQGSWDITYIERVHSWPFLTAHPSSNSSAPASWDWNFFSVRQGTAFSILGVNDWTKITDCFSYGYETGFHIKGGRNVIMRGCGADNASVGMTRGVTPSAQDLSQGGYNVLPNSRGFHVEINNLSSEELYTDYRAITPQDSNNDGFINHSEKSKGGTGSFSFVNCQAAAQSVGFELHTNDDESGTLTACQSWYCDSHIKAKGSVKVSVMNHLVDNAGYIASGTTGATGLRTEGNASIMAIGIQFKELSNATFADKTLGSNVSITGQQDV